jgi:hypothetical protein
MSAVVFSGDTSGQISVEAPSIAGNNPLTLPTATDTLVGKATTDTLSNKTLTAPVIATIVNTGTLTLPTSTDTLVGRATTDVLTNKTLILPVIATISNTGTLTLPISTDTLVGRATTDALTNKTYNGNTWTAGASTLTLAGNLVTSGAYNLTATLTANTSITMPITGTLATLAGSEALTNKTYNGNTWTAGTGTLTIAAAKTLTANNSLTLAGTDSTTMTFPATTGTVATLNTANTFSVNQIISVTDNTNAALRVTQLGTGNAILVEDATNPDATPFLVSATGQVVAGTTAAVSFSGGATPLYETVTTTQLLSGFGAALWNSTITTGPTVRLAHSLGSTIGTHSVLSNNGVMGELIFEGSDGTGFIEGACIRAEVDGTPGTNDMPGRLMFATTADGAATRTDRWQIGNNGYLKNLSGAFGRGAPVTKTENFTVADTDNWLISNKAGSTCTVTFPAASSWTGREIMFQNYENHTVVSASSNVVPLGGGAAGTALLQSVPGKWCTVVSDGTNWVILQAG